MSIRALLICFLCLACNSTEETTLSAPLQHAAPVTSSLHFVEVASAVGLTWQHENGRSPQRYFPETMGGGGAFFDYDGDGDLDVYAVNGAFIAADPQDGAPVNRLFRNDGQRFVPVAAGVAHAGVGMGVAAADYDRDGDLDLYLTNFGSNALFRNDDGHFAEIGQQTGVADARWGTSCAFADYDRDGDLDLYVANYVAYDPAATRTNEVPYMASYESYGDQAPIGYPHPDNFQGQPDLLYRNDGAGHLVDVSAESGIADASGKGLGVVFGDYDRDGWPDIYVANDAVRNFLYHNNQDGTFTERAGLAGVAYGQDGQMEAGMGVDWGDYNGDGVLDLTVTNFQAEPNALYRGEGGFFSVSTFAAGVGLPSLPFLGFGTQFFDPDFDGDLDLFAANGHVLDNVRDIDQSTSYGQRNLLFRNDGGRFAEVSATAGPGFALERVSRGSATGDYDGDGDPDLLVFNSGQPPSLLRNDQGDANHWITIQLAGVNGNPNGIGARLTATSGDLVQTRELRGSRSYLSQSQLRICLGLGKRPQLDALEVRWPSGRVERFGPFAANQAIALVEGEGISAASDPP
ncbi:MAG: CRTAC1 family protein [Candidatus Latescibacteria bacterium]|nr:CRTAC1 family protein [Candidatus Latescibacterota bacterium]